MKSTFIRIILLVLLACSPLYFSEIQPLLPAYESFATVYNLFFLVPFVLFALVGFLGLRLNQTRIFYAMILYTFIFLAVHKIAIAEFLPTDYPYFLRTVSVISLITFIAIFAIDEGSLFGIKSLFKAIGIGLNFVLCYLIVDSQITFFHTLFHWQWLISLSSWGLPDILWPFLIGAAILLLVRQDKAVYSFKVALVLSFISLQLALNKNIVNTEYSTDLKLYNAFAFAIIGFISLYAVYKLYWQNVYIDELTGVANRRAFNEHLKKLGRKYTIAMIDIDHFKKFNDTYGHREGDNVLRYVAAHIADLSHARVFRYGGEEFSAIYSGRTIKEVLWHLEQMRESLAERKFYIRMSETRRSKRSEKDRGKTTDNGKKVNLTISIGIAQRNNKHKIAEDVIEAADKALYQAKRKGRNQCVTR